MILQNVYSFEVDVWSLGIIAYELTMGFAPNSQLNPPEIMASTIYNEAPRLKIESISEDIKDFVAVCLRKNPAEVFCFCFLVV